MTLPPVPAARWLRDSREQRATSTGFRHLVLNELDKTACMLDLYVEPGKAPREVLGHDRNELDLEMQLSVRRDCRRLSFGAVRGERRND